MAYTKLVRFYCFIVALAIFWIVPISFMRTTNEKATVEDADFPQEHVINEILVGKCVMLIMLIEWKNIFQLI